MALYTLRQAEKADLPKLLDFINVHWKKNHALVLSRNLLDFQHLQNDKYNFLIAENNITHTFDALIGFIPLCQFDSELKNNGDYWGAIWKIRDDIQNEEINTAGFVLWRKLFKLPEFKSYAAIGISEIAKAIYKVSRIPIHSLNQYYIINDDLTDFHIAHNIPEKFKNSFGDNDDWNISWITPEKLKDINLAGVYRPMKSIDYLINRYAKHPIYKYRFLGIYNQGNLQCILVTRDVRVDEAKAIRVIDAYGKLGGDIGFKLLNLLKSERAEYIDFLNFGIPKEVFFEMGFKLLDFVGDLIIPNYFEPFEQRNIKVELAYKADFDYIAFKGDSDQDRPNIINDK